MTIQFEEHVRTLMATGATARAVRDGVLLNAGHFLSASEAALVYYTKGSIGVGIVCLYLHAHSRMRKNNSVGIR